MCEQKMCMLMRELCQVPVTPADSGREQKRGPNPLDEHLSGQKQQLSPLLGVTYN